VPVLRWLLSLQPQISRRGTAVTEPREAHESAWSLLPLWGEVGGPKAPASWPHSTRFARFARRAAQPVRTVILSSA